MTVDRRKFLKLAGITALVAAGHPCLSVLKTGAAHASDKSEKNRSGTRWAMTIDLKSCKCSDGCTACSEACHTIHNVPLVPDKDHPGIADRKEELKWIWANPFSHSFPGQDHSFVPGGMHESKVPILCNHCDNPPCVRVCPTKATFKRKDGIVIMDFHRCIGCRYCMAACPYGSRSFNWRDPRPNIAKIAKDFPTRTKGVVEKCNFCAERIARHKNPYCVEICPEKAMAFGDLNNAESDVRKVLKENYSIRRKPELGTSPEVYYIV